MVNHVEKERVSQPEIDYSEYVPVCEISRICADDWRDVKKGKFAVPERSVLTVVSREHSWATGRQLVLDSHYDIKNGVVEDIIATSLPMVESSSERPHRVAVTGHDLHKALERIFNCPISLINNVWVWPFKHFILYESDIRKCLDDEEAKIKGARSSKRNSFAPRPEVGNNSFGEPPSDTHVKETGNVADKEQIAKELSATDTKAAADTRLRDQLRCLIRFMDYDMKEIFDVKRKLADGSLRTIAFQHLWQLYSPGDVIFTSEQDTNRRAYRVLHVTGGRAILDSDDQPPGDSARTSSGPIRSWERHGDQGIAYAHSKNTTFIIDCFYIDFDGQNFGPVPRRFVIPEYEGEKDIDSLPAFPAKFDQNCKETEKMLTKRGKRFVKLAGVTHKRYLGMSAREPSVLDYQDEVCQNESFHMKIIEKLISLT